MTIFHSLLLAGLIVAFYAQRSGKPWARGLMALLVGVALVAGGFAVWRKASTPSRLATVMDANQEAGRVLGEQIARQLPEGGDVLVLCQAPIEGEKAFTDSPLLGLRAALSNSSVRLTLGGPALQGRTVTDPRFVAMRYPELSRDVAGWLATNAQVKAVVSLLPYPPDSVFTAGRPVVAFVARQLPIWEAAMAGGICKAALVDKASRQDGAAPPSWSTFYDLVTPETLAAYQQGKGAAHSP